MKVQLCVYSIKKDGEVQQLPGLAFINCFNIHDVKFIIDLDSGEKVGEIWNYSLLSGPLSYIDSSYVG